MEAVEAADDVRRRNGVGEPLGDDAVRCWRRGDSLQAKVLIHGKGTSGIDKVELETNGERIPVLVAHLDGDGFAAGEVDGRSEILMRLELERVVIRAAEGAVEQRAFGFVGAGRRTAVRGFEDPVGAEEWDRQRILRADAEGAMELRQRRDEGSVLRFLGPEDDAAIVAADAWRVVIIVALGGGLACAAAGIGRATRAEFKVLKQAEGGADECGKDGGEGVEPSRFGGGPRVGGLEAARRDANGGERRENGSGTDPTGNAGEDSGLDEQ